MKKFLLLIVGSISLSGAICAQSISILPAGTDIICGPNTGSIQLTVNPYTPGTTYKWWKQNYNNWSQTGMIGIDTLGYGQSVTYTPSLSPHGTTLIFCYSYFPNGTVNATTYKYIYYTPDVIPYRVDTINCKTITVPTIYSYDQYLAVAYKDGVAIPGNASSINSPTTGNYQIILNLPAGGCSISTPIIPIVNSYPVPTIVNGGALNFCSGDSVTLSTSTANVSYYQWQKSGAPVSGALNSNYYAKTSGSYNVMVIYNTNCIAYSAPAAVTALPLVTITATDTAACMGDTVTLTSQAASGYSWEMNGVAIGGATSQTLKAWQTGTYKVNTTGLACNKSITVPLAFDPIPSVTVSAGGPLSLHAGTGVLLSAIPTNSNIFQWYRNGISIQGQTNPAFYVNQAGTYKCEVSNSCQKIKSASKAVTVISGNQLPKKTITIQPDSISGKDAFVNNFLPGNNTGNLAWLFAMKFSTNTYRTEIQFDLSAIPPSTIINTAKLTLYQYTPGSNVISNASYLDPIINPWNESTVTWLNQPEITTYNRTSIPSTTTDLLDINVKGAVVCMVNQPSKNYGWRHWLQSETVTETVKSASSDHTTPSLRPKLVVNYAYAKIDASPSNICNGSPVTLSTNTGPYTYQWKKNGIIIPGETSISTIVTTAGNYSVVITDPTGCTVESAQKQINASTTPAATITASGPTTFCLGDSVTFQANAGTGLTYQWKNNSVSIAGAIAQTHTAKTAGTYRVVVTEAGGCSKGSPTKTVTIPCRMDNSVSQTAEMEVFPNPSSHDFFLKISGLNTEVYCNIYDIRGLKIKSFLFNSNEGLKFGEDLVPGCYLVEVVAGQDVNRKVIIKQ